MEKLTSKPFLYFLRKFKRPFAIGFVALIVTDFSDILGPYVMGQLLDKFQDQKSLESTSHLFLILLIASLTTAVFRYVWRIHFARFHHSVALDLRLSCFKEQFNKDLVEFEKQSTGDKMSIFSKDIENFRLGIGPGVLILIDALLYLTFIPIAMWRLNSSWAMVLLFVVPIIPIVIALMEKKLNSLFDQQQNELSNLSSLAQESLEGIKVIKSFRMEKFRSSLYDLESQKLFKTSTKLDFLHSSFSPVLEFFVSISCAGLLFIVAYFSDLSSLKVGTLFAFYQYMQRMTWPLTALGLSYMMISEAKSSFKRIKTVIENSPSNDKSLNTSSDAFVELQETSFSYPKESLFFKDLNLRLQRGHSYLITGKTKSGKTTLFNILNGLIQIQKGSRHRSADSVSNPQVPFLFMDSVDNNIDPNKKPIQETDLKKISFFEEYQDLKEKGQTLIGERGTSLSGGQKQRLSLLRSLKSNASNLFLDEPISAVDEKTKNEIIETLKSSQKEGKSLVVVTSNPEHYTWMDHVLLVEEGPKNRTVKSLSMTEALEEKAFQNLLRQKEKESIKNKDHTDTRGENL